MRHLLVPAIAGALGAVALAQPAAADYDIAYMGLRGSYVMTDEATTKGSLALDYNESYADSGYGVGLFMGWVIDHDFRLEFEGTYRATDLDHVIIVRDVVHQPQPGPSYTLPGDKVAVGGEAKSFAAMANLYYDFHLFDGSVLPWIGAGLGGVYIDYQIDGIVTDPFNPPPATFALVDGKGTSWVFGYQFMAGLTFPVAEAVSMSVGYRYLQTEDFGYDSPSRGESFETDLSQHNVDVSLQFHL